MIKFAISIFGAACVAALNLSSTVLAQPQLQTVDYYSPVQGNWNTPMAGPIRLDLGNGLGMGTITFTSLNGGSILTQAVGNTTDSYDQMLGNGTSLSYDQEINFRIGVGPDPAFLSGFRMTVTLDQGTFGAGSLFLVRSLDWWNNNPENPNVKQFFDHSYDLGTPYADVLPTDSLYGPEVKGLLANDGNGIYSAASVNSVTYGTAFPISSTSNTFAVQFYTNIAYTGAIAMTIATPIPEPASGLLVLAAGVVFTLYRRRRGVKSEI
ncbi:MAG: PEP-CTERM sorting domain-containing protein [Verrucomicrobium sp.]